MNDVLSELNTLLSTALSSRITTFYIGEVEPVPQSWLPACMIFGNSTEIVAKSTAKDQFVYTITIRIVEDVKDHFDEDGTGTTISATQSIINIVEERNADGTLKSDTVLGVLRENVRGTDYLFNNEITATYERLQGDAFPYVRADVVLTATTDLKER